jgi:hypothetical protein
MIGILNAKPKKKRVHRKTDNLKNSSFNTSFTSYNKKRLDVPKRFLKITIARSIKNEPTKVYKNRK